MVMIVCCFTRNFVIGYDRRRRKVLIGKKVCLTAYSDLPACLRSTSGFFVDWFGYLPITNNTNLTNSDR